MFSRAGLTLPMDIPGGPVTLAVRPEAPGPAAEPATGQ